ncbi:hypothetical protein AAVH_05801 [Aphelenchoides avenae]|nr:hypothetical protein AAVH_05801 [Aphelenchus avenae]
MARKAAGSLKDITTTGPSAEMGIGGFAGALKAYQDGTAEVRGLLLGEVATIFECNFCRSVFRSIELFVEHKRLYCGSKFSVAANEAAQAQSSSHGEHGLLLLLCTGLSSASTKQKSMEEQKVFDVQNYVSTCLAEYQKHLPTDRVLFEPELADLPQPVTSQSNWSRKSKSQTTPKPDNVTTASSKAKGRDEDRPLNRSSSSASKGNECPKAQRTAAVGQADSREREVPDLRGRRRVRNAGGPTTPSSSASSSVLTETQKYTQSTEVHETASLPEAGELLLHRTGTARDAALAWSAANIAGSKALERQSLEGSLPRKIIETSADRASGGGEDARHLETKQHALTTPIDAFKKQPGSEEARVSPSAVAGAKDVQLPPTHTCPSKERA